jgi:hypothetical protein
MLRRIKTMAGHSNKQRSRRKLHKDWRAWLGFLLMLAGMVMYVLTLDDSLFRAKKANRQSLYAKAGGSSCGFTTLSPSW